MMSVHRGETLALGAILLTVAGFAGAASFTHVHDWTMRNTPAGTPGWFGWANAVISELVPTACAVVIRRRRRTSQPIGYPLGLLVAAVALSLAAQLAVAKPGPSGWLLSAVPALAFVALTKLVLSTTSKPTPEQPPATPAAPDPSEEIAPPMLPEPTRTRANGAIPSGVIR
jgi:peptidoglycan/LPS O-acetylase OafA/YrhL